ncbi:MAG TPA: 1-deoxy-D-xylulose-5-phosphate reductoisomerase [Longimicrobiales bacterium]
MKGVALLGCTGSIGQSAIAVLDRHRDRFRVVALAANRNAAELAAQCARFQPQVAALVDPVAGNGLAPSWLHGREGLLTAATHPEADIVLNAVVGAAGLQATLAALDAGKRLALANKESLVAGGPLVLQALQQGGGELIPVDSEHSAILQCLRGAQGKEIRRLVLTASGGPFRTCSAAELAHVTREDALRHPTWDMGAKITIDSATLANKALEVIEAHFLFGIDYDRIDVVVHPQSIIHSMVEFVDGSVLAQLGFPTMELPILYALTHPERIEDEGTRSFDPVAAASLTFEPVDAQRFAAFGLGVQAGRAGGTAPAVYNAANEVAVAAFLSGELAFPAIADVIAYALEAHTPCTADSLETVLAADAEARTAAQRAIQHAKV